MKTLWTNKLDNRDNPVLETLTDFTKRGPEYFEVRLARVGDEVYTNVPWSCIEHSPCGFEWGYAGSGPSDLALNILNNVFKPGKDGDRGCEARNGVYSEAAERLHIKFKDWFLAGMDKAGGIITKGEIKKFVEQNRLGL